MSDRRPTLRQLEYFRAVAQHLNYRRAADALGVSQPTLTTQLSNLEASLGVPLFERSRRGTLLSPGGRQLLEAAKQVLLAAENLTELARRETGDPSTTFRLGIPPTVGPYLLPHVLPDLHRHYESLKLFVREAAPRQLEDGLLSGEFDLVISTQAAEENVLEVEPLFSEPLKFVVPSDHHLAERNNVAVDEIRGCQVLALEEQHHFHQQVRQLCERAGASVLQDYAGTSLDTLRQMVVMGMGVTFLPGLYVHSELHNPDALHVCEFQHRRIMRQHSLIWRNTSPNRVYFRQLASDLRNIVRQRLDGVVEVSAGRELAGTAPSAVG